MLSLGRGDVRACAVWWSSSVGSARGCFLSRARYHALPRVVKNDGLTPLGVLLRSLLHRSGFYEARTPLPLLTSTGRPGRWPFVGLLALVAVNGAVLWLWQLLGDNNAFMHRHFTLTQESLEARPYTLLTSEVSHMNVPHYVGNMVALVLFGWRVWRAVGPAAFLGLYASGAVAAGLVHVAWGRATGGPGRPLSELDAALREYRALHPTETEEEAIGAVLNASSWDRPCLGASGAVMAVAACSATLFSRDRIRMLQTLVRMPLGVAVGLFAVSDALAITQSDGVAHAAHLGGLVLGTGYVFLRRRWLYARTRLQLRRPSAVVRLAGRHVSAPLLWRALPPYTTALDLSHARVGPFSSARLPAYSMLSELRLDGLAGSVDLSHLRAPSLSVVSCAHFDGTLTGTLCASVQHLVFTGPRAVVLPQCDMQALFDRVTHLTLNCAPDDQRRTALPPSPGLLGLTAAPGLLALVATAVRSLFTSGARPLELQADQVCVVSIPRTMVHLCVDASPMVLVVDDWERLALKSLAVAANTRPARPFVRYPPTLTTLHIAHRAWWPNNSCATRVRSLTLDCSETSDWDLRQCAALEKLTLRNCKEFDVALLPHKRVEVTLIGCAWLLRRTLQAAGVDYVVDTDFDVTTDEDAYY